MNLYLFIVKFIYILTIGQSCLSGISILEIVDHHTIREHLFEVLVFEVDNCETIFENLIIFKNIYLLLDTRREQNFLLSILKGWMDLTIRVYLFIY